VNAAEVVDLCRSYSLFEWGTQEVNPLAIDRGEGCYLYTMDGRQILDFNSISMNVNIGHGDQRITEAVAHQMGKVSFVSPFMVTEARAEVAKKLAEITPNGLTKSFFTLSGSDANEAAIRTARLVTGRRKILSRYRSYHGSTHQVLALAGDPRRESVEGGMGDIVRIPDPYHYRCPWITDEKEFSEFNLDQIEQIVRLEGAHTIAAVIVEPITGSNGLIIPPDGWLAGLRALCDRHGILLICDEVMTGFGRTGEWFAVDHDGVTPDIMTVAKGLTSGYIPLGACIISDDIAAAVHDRPLGSGLTYQSHPVALAAASATIAIYESDDLIERSKKMGEYLLEGLQDLASRHISVGDVRGRGLFTAMELVYDQESRLELFPLTGPASKANQDMRNLFDQEGLSCALRGPFLFANPPLIVDRSQIDWALAIFDRALAVADSETASAGASAPPHSE
jgi:taurine--2-oxoglutarate transaminase